MSGHRPWRSGGGGLDLTAPGGVVRAVRGASATVVDLDGPTSPMFHVLNARDPHAGAQVYLANGHTWQYLDEEDKPRYPRT